jgi:cytochrome c oxidase subunit 2
MIVPQEQNFQLPPAMSTGAAEVDWLYMFLYWFSVVFTVLIWGATAYFVVKYKRQKGVKAEPTQDYTKLELFWTITPLIGIVFLFHWGYTAYVHNATAAEGSMEVRVRGKRWSWAFEYPTGDSEPNDLYLPVNKPVKLILSSEDVLHSFYIPAFRQKRDAVPGMYSFITFTPNQLGEAQVFCAEYCGKDHSYMLAKIHVVTDEEYKKHIDELSKMPNEFASLGVEGPAKWGESLFKGVKSWLLHARPQAHRGDVPGVRHHGLLPGRRLRLLVRLELFATAAPIMDGSRAVQPRCSRCTARSWCSSSSSRRSRGRSATSCCR